jgi:hypothetical protein
MAAGCAIICCPNCGYQVVDESKSGSLALLRKIHSRLVKKEGVGQGKAR